MPLEALVTSVVDLRPARDARAPSDNSGGDTRGEHMSVKPFLSAADCLWHWRGHSRARANVHHGHDRCGDVWRSHASLKYSLAIAAPVVMMIFLAVSTAEAITYGGSATGAQVTI